jgi:hypothetical protein
MEYDPHHGNTTEHRSEQQWNMIHATGTMAGHLGRLLQIAAAASWRRGTMIGLGFSWVRF